MKTLREAHHEFVQVLATAGRDELQEALSSAVRNEVDFAINANRRTYWRALAAIYRKELKGYKA